MLSIDSYIYFNTLLNVMIENRNYIVEGSCVIQQNSDAADAICETRRHLSPGYTAIFGSRLKSLLKNASERCSCNIYIALILSATAVI